MHRIMIVEDDPVIARAVKGAVERWGMSARTVVSFKDIMPEFAEFDPSLVLLDISLPFYNGYYWCREIRRLSRVPIIFISSASDNMNIVMSMDMGGDDFIAKPFDLSVLIAKIHAVLRRVYDYSAAAPVLEHMGAELNTGDGTLRFGGSVIDLTKNEYRILLTLMESKGKIVSREQLMNRLWQTDSFVDENTLTVNVNRLRKKLERAGLCGFIKTKAGQGYGVF